MPYTAERDAFLFNPQPKARRTAYSPRLRLRVKRANANRLRYNNGNPLFQILE